MNEALNGGQKSWRWVKRSVGLLSTCLLVWCPVSAARAQSAQQVVEELNRGAMEAYNELDVERAGEMLQEALRVAEIGEVSAELLARTQLNMGVIFVGALDDQESAFGHFLAAVCADRSVELDVLTSTPNIQRAFQTARQQAEAGGCPVPQPRPAVAPTDPIRPREEVEKPPPVSLPWNTTPPSKEPTGQRRFFLQVGFNTGFAWLRDGMPTDHEPPADQVFVESPGFVPTVGVRFAVGYFFTERFSFALPVRVQLDAGEGGVLKNLQLGLRAEWQWLHPRPTGLLFSNFAGFTVGELRARPPYDHESPNDPFVVSGPAGAHLGVYMLRYRFHPNLGLYSAAELDVQFPKFLFNIDWTPIGLELAL